jgi:hypothetical protein
MKLVLLFILVVALVEARRSKNGALCHKQADVVYIAGKKYLAHREVGSGRFCDIVSWKASSSRDQLKQHLDGQDRNQCPKGQKWVPCPANARCIQAGSCQAVADDSDVDDILESV